MRDTYVNVKEGAVVHLMGITGDKAWILTSIGVSRPSNRGKGAASRLLNVVTADADAEDVLLVLSVEPDGTDGLGFHELIAFYERHGFISLEHGEGMMYRNPRGAKLPVPEWLICF